MRGVCKERPEGLEYHQRTSHGQRRVEVSYPHARTMTRLSRSYGFHL
uniref:Uncharacterized protein n=1 Tax=Arundo donax TaxID=35708 RepID=A0A0A9FT47_ARUDO